MGQITEEFARQMLAHCERKEHPPLTVWETEQLVRAWLEREQKKPNIDKLINMRGMLEEICTAYYEDGIAEGLRLAAKADAQRHRLSGRYSGRA